MEKQEKCDFTIDKTAIKNVHNLKNMKIPAYFQIMRKKHSHYFLKNDNPPNFQDPLNF